MKIRITENGLLEIVRSGKGSAKQYCPFTSILQRLHGEYGRCGDWCPLFGEPITGTSSTPSTTAWSLTLCHKALWAEPEHFVDLR